METVSTKMFLQMNASTLSCLECGELYLFGVTEDGTSPDVVWGVVDKVAEGRIYLESCSCDLQKFEKWRMLDEKYRYFRLSSRDELRDYTVALVFDESRLH